jgi:hypothetical protein
MFNLILFGLMVLGFGTFVTVHVVVSMALLISHPPRWRGLVALVLPPLAPIWAWQAGRRRMAAIWAIALGVYAVARLVALIR